TSEDALTTSAPAVTSEPEPVETTEAEVTTEAPDETAADSMDQSEDGAIAFAEHYLQTLNTARESGETETLASLAHDSCKSCANFEETASSGGLPPLEYQVRAGTSTREKAVVIVDVTEGSTSGTAYFELVWADGWLVTAVKAEGWARHFG